MKSVLIHVCIKAISYSFTDKQSRPPGALCTLALVPHASHQNASIPSLPESCEFNVNDSSLLWPFSAIHSSREESLMYLAIPQQPDRSIVCNAGWCCNRRRSDTQLSSVFPLNCSVLRAPHF